MGKKKADVMAKMKAKFVDGAAGRGMPPQRASDLWDKIEPFAGYGFNKSHSVAYAMVAYQTAYLKAHHPVAFMAAMLNSELSSSDEIAKYIAECRQNMGIDVLPPDINESGYVFTVVGDKIRFGLGAVKGVGEGAIESLLDARRRVGHFRSLAQVATEVDLRLANRKVWESFVKAGAFDSFGVHRAALWASLDSVIDYGQRRRREREEGQTNLFGGGNAGSLGNEPMPDASVPPWPERERVKFEKEALGFYLTGNPLTEHQAQLERMTTHSTVSLREGAEGTVTVGGIVSSMNRVKIKSGPNAGKLMGRFVLEDLEGSLPVTLFASQLEKFGHLLSDDAVVLVKGQVRERGSDFELTVEEIVPVTNLGPTLAKVELVFQPSSVSTKTMLNLSNLLKEHPGDVPVKLCIELPEQTVWITPKETYKIDFGPELATSIEGILGHGSIRESYLGPVGTLV
jgi:DNA polymerase-3 subunit alpha